MKTRIKMLLTATILMLASLVAKLAFHLMNTPADPVFYGGVLLLLALLMVLPTLYVVVWKTKKVDKHEETPTA